MRSRAISGGATRGRFSGEMRVAEKAQVQDTGNVSVTVLREVRDRLEARQVVNFLAPLQEVNAEMSWGVAGTSLRLDYFLFRLVFSRFRVCKFRWKTAKSAIDLITRNGGTARQLEIAFKQELLPEFPKANIADLVDQVALMQSIAARGLLGDQTIKKWAGETLGEELKTLFQLTDARMTRFHKVPKPEIIETLVDLGAAPSSTPPGPQREQEQVAFYLSNIPRPELVHAFYRAWNRQPEFTTTGTAASETRLMPRPVNRDALFKIRTMLADTEARFDASLDNGTRTKTAKHDLQRLLDYTAVRYLAVLGQLKPGTHSWQGSVVGGPLFTSKSHPWPETKGHPDVPLVQLELDAITEATGIPVGTGFLQVWGRVGYRTKGRRAAKPKVRLIPRSTVIRCKQISPAPPRLLALSAHPDFSWRLSRTQGPVAIAGWREVGYAVPDPELLYPGFLYEAAQESASFAKVLESILHPSAHDCSLELFGFPQPTWAFLRLPEGWQPLATIRGPMYGAPISSKCTGRLVRDITQIFYLRVGARKFEYKSFSWRDFYGE